MNIGDLKKLRFVEGDLITATHYAGAIWKAIRIDEKGVTVLLHSCKTIPQERIDRENAANSMANKAILSGTTPGGLFNPFGWSKATPKQIAEWRMDATTEQRDPSQQTDEAPYGKL